MHTLNKCKLAGYIVVVGIHYFRYTVHDRYVFLTFVRPLSIGPVFSPLQLSSSSTSRQSTRNSVSLFLRLSSVSLLKLPFKLVSLLKLSSVSLVRRVVELVI